MKQRDLQTLGVGEQDPIENELMRRAGLTIAPGCSLIGKTLIFVACAESEYDRRLRDWLEDQEISESEAHMALGWQEQFRDAKLSREGRAQACRLPIALEGAISPARLKDKFELVVSSPLRRGMQTATLAFCDELPKRHVLVCHFLSERVDGSADMALRLDDSLREVADLGSISFAEEGSELDTLRPRLGPAPTAGQGGGPSETDSSVLDRIERFWKWLRRRGRDGSERCIAVVTHPRLLFQNRRQGRVGLLKGIVDRELRSGDCVILKITE